MGDFGFVTQCETECETTGEVLHGFWVLILYSEGLLLISNFSITLLLFVIATIVGSLADSGFPNSTIIWHHIKCM